MGIFSNPGEYFKKLTEFAKATRGDESIKASARLFYRILCERGNLFGEDGRVEISDWRLMEDMNVNQRTLTTIRKVLTEKGWIKFESKGYGEYVYLLSPYERKNCGKELRKEKKFPPNPFQEKKRTNAFLPSLYKEKEKEKERERREMNGRIAEEVSAWRRGEIGRTLRSFEREIEAESEEMGRRLNREGNGRIWREL